jgi:AraC-like DNA-binding protein
MIATGRTDGKGMEYAPGKHRQILEQQVAEINNCIRAEWAIATGDERDDDASFLRLYPVEDHRYCLQLVYVQGNDATNETEIMTVEYQPAFFEMFSPEMLLEDQPFRLDRTSELSFQACSRSRALLDELKWGLQGKWPMLNNAGNSFVRTLHQTNLALQLLRQALDCLTMPLSACQLPACRFLTNSHEREKILAARQIIDQHPEQSITIKELSRKVAMNECYLKKGFKALTGNSIHEYQQKLRIAKAKDMLQAQQSVTDVAHTLGYSSISHFSTAFKKATGLKPCELLR